MHPRNPYSTPVDFKKLAVKYPEFRKYCQLKPNGDIKYNFNNDEAVRTLSKAILKEDFSLDVNLPKDCLVPRIPSRLNYLLFIDDILRMNNLERNVTGIDIGTGASCIYALLGARHFDWRFIAVDSQPSSVVSAKENVENNNLGHLIAVVHSGGPNILKDLIYNIEEASFTMCNPPFFQEDELDQRFTEEDIDTFVNVEKTCARPPPKSTTIAKKNEIETEGGEVSFVSRMIDESVTLRDKIKLFTSLLGKKKSIISVKKKLQSMQEIKYCISTLKQGKTHRWVVAWSFSNLIFEEHVFFKRCPPERRINVKEPEPCI